MNECYLHINRISDIEFKFILYELYKSVVLFKAKIEETCTLTILAYNELADYLYSHQPQSLWIRGEVRGNAQIIIKEIYKIHAKGGKEHEKGEY